MGIMLSEAYVTVAKKKGKKNTVNQVGVPIVLGGTCFTFQLCIVTEVSHYFCQQTLG